MKKEQQISSIMIYYCNDCMMAYISQKSKDYKCPFCKNSTATNIIENYDSLIDEILKIKMKELNKN